MAKKNIEKSIYGKIRYTRLPASIDNKIEKLAKEKEMLFSDYVRVFIIMNEDKLDFTKPLVSN